MIRADDFYADANQKLYAHLLAMHDEGKRIDATLLLERLTQAGDLEAIGGAAYLAEVVHSVPYAANAVYYAEIVRDKATLRALIHASTEILRDAYEPTLDPRRNGQPGRADRSSPSTTSAAPTRSPTSTTCWSRRSTASTPGWNTARAWACPPDSTTSTT